MAGDFNGDGRLDLAVADYGSYDLPDQPRISGLTVLLGNGDGTFQTGATYSLPGRPSALVAVNLNAREDDHLDLAVALGLGLSPDFPFGDSIVVLQGDGRGAFAIEQVEGMDRLFPVGTQPRDLVAGDFDGDTLVDLAIANYYGRSIAVLLGDGLGAFRNDAADATYPTAGAALDLATGDFDGDNNLDLAVVTAYDSGVSVFLNQGDGTFSTDPVFYYLGARVTSLAVGDFDGDDRLDIAFARQYYTYTYSYPYVEAANTIRLLLGNGLGDFELSEDSFDSGVLPVSVAVSDANEDGRLDVAIVNNGAAIVTTLLGAGDGSFLNTVLAPDPVQSTPIAADFFGAGQFDVAMLNQTGQILLRRARRSSRRLRPADRRQP